MEKKILLVAAIAGVLGLGGITWGLSSSPSPRPVAIMHQSQPIAASASNVAISDARAKAPNDQLAQSLKAVSKYSDRLQTAAKSNDWQQAQADLIRLRRSVYQLSQQFPYDNPGIQQINDNIDQLKQAVASKNQQQVKKGTNRLMQLALPIDTPPANTLINPVNSSPDS